MDLEINLNGLKLQNPFIAASGTFGYGYETLDLVDIQNFGGITTKTITLEPRAGNDLPRILETPAGLLNSIGLQNPGLKVFKETVLPKWDNIKKTALIVSVGGDNIDEYVSICSDLKDHARINAFELNISCPNVKKGCMAIGQDLNLIKELITKIKDTTDIPIIIKLSPSFPNLTEIASGCQEFGADIISLVNTFLGLKIDIKTGKPYFKNKIAGYSGPAIKPLALKLVYDINQVVDIPIIGMGGITSFEDAQEFLLAGANAVSIGTANFINPNTIGEMVEEYKVIKNEKLKDKNNFKHL